LLRLLFDFFRHVFGNGRFGGLDRLLVFGTGSFLFRLGRRSGNTVGSLFRLRRGRDVVCRLWRLWRLRDNLSHGIMLCGGNDVYRRGFGSFAFLPARLSAARNTSLQSEQRKEMGIASLLTRQRKGKSGTRESAYYR
jgi:hypothetical protein